MAMPTKQEWTKRAEQKVKRTQLFINGKFVPPSSGKYFESLNPATEQTLTTIAAAGCQSRSNLPVYSASEANSVRTLSNTPVLRLAEGSCGGSM